MVPGDPDRQERLLDEVRVEVVITEAGLRRVEGGVQ